MVVVVPQSTPVHTGPTQDFPHTRRDSRRPPNWHHWPPDTASSYRCLCPNHTQLRFRQDCTDTPDILETIRNLVHKWHSHSLLWWWSPRYSQCSVRTAYPTDSHWGNCHRCNVDVRRTNHPHRILTLRCYQYHRSKNMPYINFHPRADPDTLLCRDRVPTYTSPPNFWIPPPGIRPIVTLPYLRRRVEHLCFRELFYCVVCCADRAIPVDPSPSGHHCPRGIGS
mmetsp:Transcript_60353/g.67529  ORF Transcript_60353/g.67529 Transcript_60353/m.67529 type:complete len:224 (-) Transcript_60353:192-863(-)